jgi:L-asparaginase
MKIALINTGGTISCVGNPLSPMSAKSFKTACQKIITPILKQEFPNLEMEYITDLIFPESKTGTLDSTNLQPTDWCLIANYILQHYTLYDGWVVLHGTDSMDFTGTALPFLLSSFNADGVATASISKPIIITGSQVPIFYQDPEAKGLSLNFNTDAFQNLCGAVAAAQTGIPEVGVYFQNNLFRGNRVIKTNASEFNAFSSPNYTALGEYGINLAVNYANTLPPPISYSVSLDNPVVLKKAIKQLAFISEQINYFPVMQFSAFPAWYNYKNSTGIISQLLDACVKTGIKGLILESYGEGNFPSGCPDNPTKGAVYQSLNKANAAGVIIVDCTQVLAGIVNDSAYGAGAWLPAVGALSPADMTPMAAFAKLMILITAAKYPENKWDTATIKKLLQLNLLGEMMHVSVLDSRNNDVLLVGQSITALDGSATLMNDAVLGPVLTTVKNNKPLTLWKAFKSKPAATDMPGRLQLQTDGTLIFYNRYNKPLWVNNTGAKEGAAALLNITGSVGTNNLALQVYNCLQYKVANTLYSQ